MTTDGGLLDGRLRYLQPAVGFRSGLEPVLLAASVPARAGERILEAGTGAGAALLCLQARLPGVETVGVELDPGMAALAAANAARNDFAAMTVETGDILSIGLSGRFDHAIANPPYHPLGTASPLESKERAKRGTSDLLRGWIIRLGALLQPRGSLTLVLPSHAIPTCITAMEEAKCPCSVLFPLWPGAGRPAKLLLVRGVREAKAPLTFAAGLVLHDAGGGFTDAAQAVLRHGAALPLH